MRHGNPDFLSNRHRTTLVMVAEAMNMGGTQGSPGSRSPLLGLLMRLEFPERTKNLRVSAAKAADRAMVRVEMQFGLLSAGNIWDEATR